MKREAPDTSARRCRKCGCTDDRACPGGCWWVAEDLCSSCDPNYASAVGSLVRSEMPPQPVPRKEGAA